MYLKRSGPLLGVGDAPGCGIDNKYALAQHGVKLIPHGRINISEIIRIIRSIKNPMGAAEVSGLGEYMHPIKCLPILIVVTLISTTVRLTQGGENFKESLSIDKKLMEEE